MIKIITVIWSIIISLAACRSGVKKNEIATESRDNFSYDIHTPDKRYELPKKLKEISGVAAVNDSIIACVADEKGVVYFFNLNSNDIDNKIYFSDKGDFEDLTIIGDTIYVLDSKGVIWSIKKFMQRPTISSVQLNIDKPFELEGICHRADTLFVAAKYYHNKKRDSEGRLPIWKMSMPLMQVDIPFFDLPDIVKAPNGVSSPFHTSALIFDEINKEWIFISTHSKWMIRCGYSGNILFTQSLSAQEFTQPEGICFTPSGNLLISNEGREGIASILLFTRKNMR
ncbi:hypothetical protein QWZ08_10585 [Ferruginibacter paludis]|uniref:hypothetical protein n=1 Tax=Ferruginibacter paludis TaxID=1310417 RepID=UPI0025B3E57A|nr:hypothetical protein [Ferruginibacter paludis]MDN3656074.1 hypothetical protein [Ferruginibacter paludis]